MKGLSQSPD